MFIRSCRGRLSKYSLETFHLNYSQSPYNGFQRLIGLLLPPCTLILRFFPYELCSYHTGLLTMPPTSDMFLPQILGVANLPAVPKVFLLSYLRTLLILNPSERSSHHVYSRPQVHTFCPIHNTLYYLFYLSYVPSPNIFNYLVSYCLPFPTKIKFL